MPYISRPDKYPEWMPDYATLPALAVEPSGSKKAAGFSREKLPYQWLNWIEANQSEWIEYLDSVFPFDRTFLVAQDGSGQFTTIADAIAQLPTGAEEPLDSQPFYIRIQPGTYTENIILPDGVHLVGACALTCIIEGKIQAGISSTDACSLTNLSLFFTETSPGSPVYHLRFESKTILDRCIIQTVLPTPWASADQNAVIQFHSYNSLDSIIKDCVIIQDIQSSIDDCAVFYSEFYGAGATPSRQILILNTPVYVYGAANVTVSLYGFFYNSLNGGSTLHVYFHNSEFFIDEILPNYVPTNLPGDAPLTYFGLHSEKYPGNLSPLPQDIFGEKTFKEDIYFKSQPDFFSKLNLKAVSGFIGTYANGAITAVTGYRGGVLLPGGLVYMTPHTANGVNAAYSPFGRSHNTAVYNYDGTAKFMGGVVLPTGYVFLVPYDYASTKFLIDINTLEPVDGPAAPAGSGKFWGGVLLPDGRVFCVPYDKATVSDVIFNPFTAAWQSISHSPWVLSGAAFKGGVLLPNGKVFCVPFGERTKFIFNPSTLDFEDGATVPGTSLDIYGFSGGVMLPNGKVLCLQTGELGETPTGSWTYDYIEDSWEETLLWPADVRFSGGCLLPNGLVVAAVESGSTEYYLYDYTINSWIPAAQTMSGGHCGAVLLEDGTAAIIPDTTTYIKIFTTSQGTRTALPWCHHNMFNKF